MTGRKEDSISFFDLLHAVWLGRVFILAMTAIGLLVGLAVSILSYMRSEISYGYTITSSFAVTSTTEDGLFSTRAETPNSTDIRLEEDMVDSVIYVIKGDKTLNAAISELSLLGITATDIRNALTLEQYKETQIVEMSLDWAVADEGVRILEAINKVAPDILIDALKIGSVTVVNEPKSSYRPAATVNVSLWFLMAAAGMLLGIGLSAVKGLLSRTVYKASDIEDNFDLAVLSEIPLSKAYFSDKPSIARSRAEDPDYSVTECFISLALILRHRLGGRKPAMLYVTSTRADEGKTAVLANLALQLAAFECSVLMVDLDIHNPTLGTMFQDKVDYYHSLNALYRGESSAEQAVVHVNACLDLLPVYLESTPFLLNDDVFSVIKTAASSYDYVLMDTSPVGCSADAMNLNRIADTTLFVVRQDGPELREIGRALARLNRSGIPVTGAVLNGAHRIIKVSEPAYYSHSKNKSETP